jgi:hypothetical protein
LFSPCFILPVQCHLLVRPVGPFPGAETESNAGVSFKRGATEVGGGGAPRGGRRRNPPWMVVARHLFFLSAVLPYRPHLWDDTVFGAGPLIHPLWKCGDVVFLLRCFASEGGS